MQDMLVSIITVCFNAVETIETTIRSVIEQTYKNIEYIIVDGGSTDGTLQIIEKYRNYVAELISEKDDGIYDAMNKGIELAHGDYIGIINADDWYEMDAIEYIVHIWEKLPANIGVISGQCRFVEGTDTFLPRKKEMKHIWTEMPVAHPATFIKKGIYGKFGKYDTHYTISADYELVFRLYINHVKFYICDKVLANYRIGGISGTRKEDLLKEDVEILSKYQEYCDIPDKVNKSILKKECIYHIYHAGKEDFCKVLDVKPELNKRIYIFGCGYWGREICRLLENHGIVVTGFIDNNSVLWGTEAENHVIAAPDVLENRCVKVIIAIQGENQDIEEQIMSLSGDIEVIWLEEILRKFSQYDRRIKE